MTTYTAVATRTYTPAEVPVHDVSKLKVFIPNGVANPEGWPADVHNVLVNFADSILPDVIDETTYPYYHTVLERKHALILVSTPPARGSTTGNIEDSVTYDPVNNLYGPTYRGNGVHVPPDVAMPAGLISGIHPYLDPQWFMSTKHYGMALQYLMQTLVAEFNLDATRLWGGGESAGTYGVMHCLWGPNRAAQMFPGGTGQNAQNTRILKAAVLAKGQPFHPVFIQTIAGWLVPQIPGTGTGYLINAPGGLPIGTTVLPVDSGTGTILAGDRVTLGGSSQRPRVAVGLAGGQITLAEALTTALADNAAVGVFKTWDWPAHPISLADQDALFTASPLVFAENPAVLADNIANRHAHMNYLQLGTAGAPYDKTHLTHDEQNVHGVWCGRAAKTLLAGGVWLVVEDDELSDGLEDAVIRGGVQAVYDNRLDKMDEWLNYVYLDLPPLPTEEIVIAALITELATITAANDYNTDVKAVFEGGKLLTTAPEYPCIMVQGLDTTYDDAESYPHLDGTMKVGLLLGLKSWSELHERTSFFIADVLKALQTKFLLDKFGGLFVNYHAVRAERLVPDEEQDSFGGATMELEITYRHALADPYTPATS